MNEIKVGLIGFGTVGAGVVKILQKNSKLIEKRMGAKVVLKRVADLDLETDRGVKLRPGILTRQTEDVIGDPDIDIIIELIGG
ncbi:MAG: homoserine dehydrogenase, partial [Deltaproteobacteria bacterium]|nr:homoserine dehydrogenase [Deltaproteobacteria bacterium]